MSSTAQTHSTPRPVLIVSMQDPGAATPPQVLPLARVRSRRRIGQHNDASKEVSVSPGPFFRTSLGSANTFSSHSTCLSLSRPCFKLKSLSRACTTPKFSPRPARTRIFVLPVVVVIYSLLPRYVRLGAMQGRPSGLQYQCRRRHRTAVHRLAQVTVYEALCGSYGRSWCPTYQSNV